MTALRMTQERRRELAALLDDEAELQRRYPKVAEYFASDLPGTGDVQADNLFDLAFLHYMTGGDSHRGNPYWAIVAESVTEYEGRRVVNGGSPNGSARLGYAQTILQAAYAYAIPSPETLHWVATMTQGRRLVEIGAGRGYWAHQLDRLGVEITAYDSRPPDGTENTWFPSVAGQAATWYPVGGLRELADARRQVRSAGTEGDYVLFLCWPPAWGDPMGSRALAAYERAGGTRLIYVGESKGGKSGDDNFFDKLIAGWELVDQDADFVSWWNLNDIAQCWERVP